jgi:NADPH:quinone reductase
VGYSAGGDSVDAGGLLAELKTVTGFSVGLISRARPDLVTAYRADLWRLLADGEIRPRHTVFELADLAAALDLVRTRRNTGRVAVRTGSPDSAGQPG